ncbi:hypothetical protein [Herpetosiphon llansteffanensis]|uniref:hypothetical protein n=1 Tax=Herpetosiphon llansteffanensis TaxID=2094568 RepID=UPI000D7C6738|nr:hypothetical protein [Herpetosiphon llansteffanensis]
MLAHLLIIVRFLIEHRQKPAFGVEWQTNPRFSSFNCAIWLIYFTEQRSIIDYISKSLKNQRQQIDVGADTLD